MSPLFGAMVGVTLGAAGLGAVTWGSGCANDDSPPNPSAEPSGSSGDPFSGLPTPPTPDDSDAPLVEEPDPPAKAQVEEPVEDKPWQGPWLGALAQATPIYPTARLSRNRMGYIRRGGKVPVVDKPIKTASCKKGFYPLVDGGYVCGKYATTNVEDPRITMGVKAPDIEALLPYKYAYNRAHGTPLYISVPSKDEMMTYEPYLATKGKKKKSAAAKRQDDKLAADGIDKADQPRPSTPSLSSASASASAHASASVNASPSASASASVSASPSAEPALQFLTDGGLLAPDHGEGGSPPAPEKPWWQKESVDGVKLSDLDEADGTLSKRMIKGFFIAVDRTFGWNDRMWYKATDGLIAPADRMIIPKTPDLEGIELTDGVTQAGFVTWRKGYRYVWANADDAPKRGDKLKRFTAFALTGKTRLHTKERYRETVDGWWFNEKQGTYTDPGPRPAEVSADEKWIDVSLARKTLLAFVGDKPVYAAIISPGKRSKIKAKDHRTKIGKWRVREKHITTTMDGDGPSGDLPYSIQDVPYVQYYDGSYALHGAFWHNNFGRQQSHGCVNLSPHDAKHLFFWTEPQLPRGWHGVWSSNKRKGTLVVVHD